MRKPAFLLLLPLAACAGHQPKSMYSYWAPRAPAAYNKEYPSYVPDRIDGSYQGTASLIKVRTVDLRHTFWDRPKVDDQLCPHTTYGVTEIDSHVLYYAYTPNLIFAAPVKDDGTITQTVGAASLTGKVAHDWLNFSIVTPLCTTKFTGEFKLNHS